MSYKILGDYIRKVDNKNKDLKVLNLQGLSMTKEFRKSTSNIVGTDLSKYKIVKQGQFCCDFMSVIRVHKLPVVLNDLGEDVIISPAYIVFEVIDTSVLLPEYLMLWFRRSEFDRYADFRCDSSIRGGFQWEELCEVELPIPSIEKQREIVAQYEAVANKIKVNEEICDKLEATSQALYKQWFVDREDKEIVYLAEYIETNPALPLRKGQKAKYTEMSDLSENKLSIKDPVLREYNGGSRFQNLDTLLARITPCLENGKTGFVNYLDKDEIAFGSTEFIVIRPKSFVSPYWVYCLCKDEDFRSFAISSMVGSSGRQRVHESYLLEYKYLSIEKDQMEQFHLSAEIIFEEIKLLNNQNQKLTQLQSLLLSRLATLER